MSTVNDRYDKRQYCLNVTGSLFPFQPKINISFCINIKASHCVRLIKPVILSRRQFITCLRVQFVRKRLNFHIDPTQISVNSSCSRTVEERVTAKSDTGTEFRRVCARGWQYHLSDTLTKHQTVFRDPCVLAGCYRSINKDKLGRDLWEIFPWS